MIALDTLYADVDSVDHGRRHVTTCSLCGGCGEDCSRCGRSGQTTHDEDDCPGYGECDEAVEVVEADEVESIRELAVHHLRRDHLTAEAVVLSMLRAPLALTDVLLSLMGDVRLSRETEEALSALFWSACAEVPMVAAVEVCA